MDPEDQRLLTQYRRSIQRGREAELLSLLRKGMFHLTTIEGLGGILKAGAILPNDGRFPFLYPQTANSYGFAHQYISIFDFESPSEEACILEHPKWSGFFTYCRPASVLIQLRREELAPRLIPNGVARQEIGYSQVWMPVIEVWYPEPIPLRSFVGFSLLVPSNPLEIVQFGMAKDNIAQMQDDIRGLSYAEGR